MDMFQASFARYLQENGLGTTRQRLHIAAIFFALGGRHNEEELFAAVRATMPRAGRTTVYRTLKLLCRAGLAFAWTGEGRALYQAVSGAMPKRLQCPICGRVAEIPGAVAEALRQKMLAACGYRILGVSLVGLCPACRARSEGRLPIA